MQRESLKKGCDTSAEIMLLLCTFEDAFHSYCYAYAYSLFLLLLLLLFIYLFYQEGYLVLCFVPTCIIQNWCLFKSPLKITLLKYCCAQNLILCRRKHVIYMWTQKSTIRLT